MKPGTIPYGRQMIGDDDAKAVLQVLRSPLITTGPKVPEFERMISRQVKARETVAVSSGTAALQCAMAALRGRASRNPCARRALSVG